MRLLTELNLELLNMEGKHCFYCKYRTIMSKLMIRIRTSSNRKSVAFLIVNFLKMLCNISSALCLMP